MVESKCQFCSKIFLIKPSHKKRGWGKFCSNSCKFEAQHKGKTVSCFNCGNSIYRSPKSIARSKSGKYFCSKSCQTFWRNSYYVGIRSARWRSGISTYRNILLRAGVEPRCALCNVNDTRILTVHHKDHVRKNNILSNLVWMCYNCHYLLHRDKDLDKKMREIK